jgi:hypothetical protein
VKYQVAGKREVSFDCHDNDDALSAWSAFERDSSQEGILDVSFADSDSPRIVIVAERGQAALRYEDHRHVWQATQGVAFFPSAAAAWTLNREGLKSWVSAARQHHREQVALKLPWALAKQAYVEFINEPTALPASVEWATADQ